MKNIGLMKLFFLTLIPILTNAQLKIDDFSGIWKYSTDERGITIFNKTEVVDLFMQDYLGNIRVSFSELFFLKDGYQDKKNFLQRDAFTQDVSEATRYIMIIDKNHIEGAMTRIAEDWSDFRYGSSFLYDFIPQRRMILDNVNVHSYHHYDRLSKKEMYSLYQKCKTDSVNYIKNYLNIDVRNITIEKSAIYDSLEAKTKMYLIKDDLVTIINEQGSFLKMEYETDKGEIIKGLVKKEDVQALIEK